MSSAVLESRPEVGSSKSNKLGRREGGREGRKEGRSETDQKSARQQRRKIHFPPDFLSPPSPPPQNLPGVHQQLQSYRDPPSLPPTYILD
jgi:hypothetical protein